MTKLKLVYFDLAGRAETARWMLHYKNVDFEDARISKDEFVAKYKPTLPMGQLPVLYVDEHPLTQSNAIYRWIARAHDLDGRTSRESAQVDAVNGCVDDLYHAVSPYVYEADAGRKEKILAELINGAIGDWLTKIHRLVGDDKGAFIFGARPTYADFALAVALTGLGKMIGQEKVKEYKRLDEIRARVSELQGVKQYLERRK